MLDTHDSPRDRGEVMDHGEKKRAAGYELEKCPEGEERGDNGSC